MKYNHGGFSIISPWYNKSADTLLFLLLFTTGQREKNIEKKLFESTGAQKR